MKLIKIVAVTAFIGSVGIVSENVGSDLQVQKFDVAGGCPTWPYCRDVDFADQTLESTTQVVITQSAIKAV